MRSLMWVVLVWCVCICGCEAVRFVPGEAMKENAWVHQRTAQLAVDAAVAEDTSQRLRELTTLCRSQSRAFVADYGLPKELPAVDTAEQVLSQANRQLAASATEQAQQRPDIWDAADGLLELGIGIAGIIGGMYGLRAGQFLKCARDKSQALKEIIEGNELFKQLNAEASRDFKEAHKNQSPITRGLVTEIKAG
jgi:flagellar motility protein MotE (MotC chaperone)